MYTIWLVPINITRDIAQKQKKLVSTHDIEK